MKSNNIFITFEVIEGSFKGYITLDDAIKKNIDHKKVINDSVNIYSFYIKKMRSVLKNLKDKKKSEGYINSLIVWRLGDLIFKLTDDLKKNGFILDRIYEHLSRDLNKHPKWIQHTVSFRRYIPDKSVIPENQKWGNLSRAIKRNSLKLLRGIPIE